MFQSPIGSQKKTLSIPRLEMCSMVLGAQMIQTVETTVNQKRFATEMYE